jgi:hypothetical protein
MQGVSDQQPPLVQQNPLVSNSPKKVAEIEERKVVGEPMSQPHYPVHGGLKNGGVHYNLMNEVSDAGNSSNAGDIGGAGEDTSKRGHLGLINCNIYQAAILNKLLPPGFKIDVEEIVKRTYEQKLAA